MRSIILLEGNGVEEEALYISLMNAKQIIIGRIPDIGSLLFIEATSVEDYKNALVAFAAVPNVTAVVPLYLKSS